MSDATASGARTEGGCLCGAVRFAYVGEPKEVTHCHCADCRRAVGAPFVTWVGVAEGAFTVTLGDIARCETSPGVLRGFCARCGTSLTYTGGPWPGVYLTAATLDEPNAVEPATHAFHRERLAWVKLADGLPTEDGFTPAD